MNIIKQNVDTLFSTADNMHPDDLDTSFKTIMEVGDKALKHSGKYNHLFIKYNLI